MHVCCLESSFTCNHKISRPPAAPEAFLVPLALAFGHGLSVARHGGRDPFPCPGWPGVRNSYIVSDWRNIRETSPNNPCSSFSRNASDILCSFLFIISDSNAVDDRTCKPTLAKHSLSLNQHCIPISNLKLSTMLCTVQHMISCISKHVISTHEHHYINVQHFWLPPPTETCNRSWCPQKSCLVVLRLAVANENDGLWRGCRVFTRNLCHCKSTKASQTWLVPKATIFGLTSFFNEPKSHKLKWTLEFVFFSGLRHAWVHRNVTHFNTTSELWHILRSWLAFA